MSPFLPGGDCLNVGCVPSKGVIIAARVAHTVKNAQDFGIKATGGVEIDFSAVMQRMRRLRARISDNDSARRFALRHGLGLKQIASTIHPYPTQAEAIRKVGDLYNRTRLTPFVKTLFRKWLSWTR